MILKVGLHSKRVLIQITDTNTKQQELRILILVSGVTLRFLDVQLGVKTVIQLSLYSG